MYKFTEFSQNEIHLPAEHQDCQPRGPKGMQNHSISNENKLKSLGKLTLVQFISMLACHFIFLGYLVFFLSPLPRHLLLTP